MHPAILWMLYGLLSDLHCVIYTRTTYLRFLTALWWWWCVFVIKRDGGGLPLKAQAQVQSNDAFHLQVNTQLQGFTLRSISTI